VCNLLLISIPGYLCELFNNNRKMKQKGKNSKFGIMAFLILAGVSLLASCEKYTYLIETVNPADSVHFQTEIQPVFTANCIVCHKGTRDPDLREGNSYTSLTTGGFVDLPAESSRLYVQVTSSSHESFSLPVEKQKILIWIQQGARNN